MPTDNVILLCLLSAIVASLIGGTIAYRFLKPPVVQEVVDSAEQEKAAAILIHLNKANTELEAAITLVNAMQEIHRGAQIKEQLDALTKRAFRLKDRYGKQIEKLAGKWIDPPPAEPKGSNGSKSASQKIQEALAAASASLGRKVGFKEMIRALGEVNPSIKTVEDFAKLDASKQDSSLSAALARFSQTKSEAGGDPWSEPIVTPAPRN